MSGFTHIRTWIDRIICLYKYKSYDRDWSVWVFGEWFGEKCNDSSMALINYVAEHYHKLNLYWIAKSDCTGLEGLHSRVKIVQMDSEEAKRIMPKAGVVFVNEGLQDLSDKGFNYFNGGIIVNLWHGIAWKKIGMDSYKSNQIILKIYARLIYKLQTFSFFITQSARCSRTLKSGFMLKSDQLIKAGLPRNQIFYDETQIYQCRDSLIKYLKECNSIAIENNTKIIIYLPTFRDRQEDSFSFLGLNDTSLNRCLEEIDAIIVEKSHIVNESRGIKWSSNVSSNRIIAVNEMSAQQLMAASDMLITDYSSCFFDYLILDRPIIHFLYDYDYYKNDDRGLYYAMEDVICGDAVFLLNELENSIRNNLNNPELQKTLRLKRKKQFLSYEIENSCEVIINRIFDEINKKRKAY